MLGKIKIHKMGAALATAGVLMAASFGSQAASMTFTLATSGTEDRYEVCGHAGSFCADGL